MTISKDNNLPVMYPWYVHIIGGWSLGPLMPWFLTSKQFYCRGHKMAAAMFMGLTLVFYAIFASLAFMAEYSWDQIALLYMTVGMSWTFMAWVLQRKYFGKAEKRYYLEEWKNWISPILVAVALGAGFWVTLSVFPIIGERIEMYQSEDLLAKKVVLWDFLRNLPYSLLLSIPLGLWWAGERERFTTNMVLCYCFGLLIFTVILSVLAGLFYFVLSNGQFSDNEMLLPVLSHDLSGIKRLLIQSEKYDYSAYIVAPLLVGTAVGMSDFWKKSFAIFPLLTISFLALAFISPQHWEFYQGQIIYEMSSTSDIERERADKQALVMLKRFPEHGGWPAIANQVARHAYENGDFTTAKELYKQIKEKAASSPKWHKEASIADAALSSTTFSKKDSQFSLEIPPLHYESYMTNNWMVLIRIMRFFEGAEISETDTLIKLKEISKDDEKIKLQSMPTLAELHDSAANLDYLSLFLPADIVTIKSLISAGYPIIQPIKNTFTILSGIDENRGVITGSSYENVLDILKKDDKEGVAEDRDFDISDAPDKVQASRIDLLSYKEIPFVFWGSLRQIDTAPYLAVVFPQQKLVEVSSLLGKKEAALLHESNSYLAALVGLNGLKSADPIEAITWAMRSYNMSNGSLSLHVAYLASLLWQSREKRIEFSLHLEKYLPGLAEVDTFLGKADIVNFLGLAKKQFLEDRDGDKLGWEVRRQYRDFLDRSEPGDLHELIKIAQMDTAHNPETRDDWLFLAGLFEWQGDITGMLKGYSGALEADAWNDEIALKIVYLSIRAGDFARAKKIMERIQPASVKFQPDYYYCLASLEKHQNNVSKAARYYEKAIKMRRYDSNYHQDYADMLEKSGKNLTKAEQMRRWVSRLQAKTAMK